jgi:uncharacterized membrane protein
MSLGLLLKHLFVPDLVSRRAFSRRDLEQMEEAIRASEQRHDGEIRFVVEASLPAFYLLKKKSSRKRAEELFSALKVWDTEQNCGVLIYVQLVSRHIDIVADRGIARKVAQPQWDEVCRAMQAAFREGRFREGSLQGIARVTALLEGSFPKTAGDGNELPDKPLIL